jgi:hypothetical protein
MWIWKDHVWNPTTVGRPPKRRGGAMAFDTKRGVLVLFGGIDGDDTGSPSNMRSDTWSWNGIQWTLHTPTQSPPPRYNAAMGYDPVRDRIVMFGGNGTDNISNLDDTWEWDGTTWTETVRGPQPREQGTFIWDSAARKLLLVGGGVAPFDVTLYSSELWSFDGAWHPLAANATPKLSPYVTPAIDRAGIMAFASSTGYGSTDGLDRVWRLRYDSGTADEACGQTDTDGDGAVGCADPDCAYLCPP